MQRIVVLTMAAVAAVLHQPMSAEASLIGDTIQVSSSLQTIGVPNPIVGDGVESWIIHSQVGRIFDIDVDASSIAIAQTYCCSVRFVKEASHITISDLNWVGSPSEIIGFSLTHNVQNGLGIEDISFGKDFVQIRMGDSEWLQGNSARIELLVREIPEPPMSLLALTVLVGATLRGRLARPSLRQQKGDRRLFG